MAKRASVTPIRTTTRTIVQPERFNLANSVGVAIIGLLVSLVGTGVASMFSLYARQASLAEQVKTTSSQIADLTQNIKNSVGKDDYVRRDNEVRRAIDKMATKEDINELRHSIDLQGEIIRELASRRH